MFILNLVEELAQDYDTQYQHMEEGNCIRVD
jgi:uncharacterized membrane-anchored protein YhcB (DUF1043 family)